MQRACGSCYADLYYDFEKAGQAAVEFHKMYPMMDIMQAPSFTSGKANEIAGSTMIDWPGRPGTKVDKYSSHQVIEREMMMPEEYPELLDICMPGGGYLFDFNGCMENAKKENLEKVFEMLELYGKY